MSVTFHENLQNRWQRLRRSWLKNRWVHHGLRLAFALLITVLLYPFKLYQLEAVAYDWRMQLSPRPKASDHIVLLPIEVETMRRLKREPEALDWAVVLQKLAQARPAAVVTFINPSQIQGSYDELSMLSDIAARLPIYFGENDLPKTGSAGLDPLAAPFENLPVEPAPKTADRTVLAKDGVTRRLILTYEDQFTLLPRLARQFNGIESVLDYGGTFQFLDSTQLLIRFRAKGSYSTLKFIDALEQPLDPELVRNKIVMIGKDTLENGADYGTTPLSKELLALSNLEIHANSLDTLIQNQAPRVAPPWLKLVFTFLISLLTIYIVLYVRPGKGLFLLALTVGAYLLFGVLTFATMSWMIPVAHPLVAVFICYYFVIPYRLIIENRKSWEYYQKNRLLEQVEELKSNFMRMMSHDLKTPLARIQGMVEVIRKNESALSSTQKMALETIAQSSDELTEFIGSILSLSRIESKEMKLHLKSRDINQLIRQAAAKLEFMAKKRRTEVVLELEPLFSIPIDPDLITTVFTNLIENAIKYSPEDTKVLVTTEEIDGEVIIQVADQGHGIPAEEIDRIFERFYRARDNRGKTAGNGLGLYLAKYFVELHNGRIEVESEINKGSTFTVRLPMNLSKETDLKGFNEQLERGEIHA